MLRLVSPSAVSLALVWGAPLHAPALRTASCFVTVVLTLSRVQQNQQQTPLSPLKNQQQTPLSPLKNQRQTPLSPLKNQQQTPLSPLKNQQLKKQQQTPLSPLKNQQLKNKQQPLKNQQQTPLSPLKNQQLKNQQQTPLSPLKVLMIVILSTCSKTQVFCAQFNPILRRKCYNKCAVGTLPPTLVYVCINRLKCIAYS